jgi:septal ring factor EnvC (AmiA/AmiB activator)
MPAKIHALLLLSASFPALCAGVDRKALPELDGAARALALATEAGAATYAPLELRFATEQLDQARQSVAAGDAKTARQKAEESAVNSDLALAKARLGSVREARQAKAADVARLKAQLGIAEDRP